MIRQDEGIPVPQDMLLVIAYNRQTQTDLMYDSNGLIYWRFACRKKGQKKVKNIMRQWLLSVQMQRWRVFYRDTDPSAMMECEHQKQHFPPPPPCTVRVTVVWLPVSDSHSAVPYSHCLTAELLQLYFNGWSCACWQLRMRSEWITLTT